MSYHPGKTSTLMDNIEEMATNWMDDQVADFYCVVDTVNLPEGRFKKLIDMENVMNACRSLACAR